VRGQDRLRIREAAPDDDPATIEILRRCDLSTRQPDAIAFYRSQPNSRAFIGLLDDEPVATGLGVRFGSVGWVGNIAVLEPHRGRGFGTAMTARAVGWLRTEGAVTALLTATREGSRIYRRLGFIDNHTVYGAWTRDPASGVPQPPEPAGCVSGTLAHAVSIDRLGTGEDRGAYLQPFGDHIRVPMARDEHADIRPAAYRICLPWGAGPIVAPGSAGPADATALLFDLVASEPAPRIGFPDSNTAAVGIARDLGFERIGEDVRMRLGPPVAGFRPEAIYGVFSFVCG
jgi:GNAT superfamily N-acetyltransferase